MLVTVTWRPMSISRPVPCFRLPKSAVAYHWLSQGDGEPLRIAYSAACGLSPSARPAGPNAWALVMGSDVTGTGLAAFAGAAVAGLDVLGLAGLDACEAGLFAVFPPPRGDAAAWLAFCEKAVALLAGGPDWLVAASPAATPAAATT